MKNKATKAVALVALLIASFVPLTDSDASVLPKDPVPTETTTILLPTQECLDLLDGIRTVVFDARDRSPDEGNFPYFDNAIDLFVLLYEYNQAACDQYANMPTLG